MFPAPTMLSDNTGPKRALIELLEGSDPGWDRSELQDQFTALIEAQLATNALHLGPAAEAWLLHDGRGILLRRLKATTDIHDAILGAVYDGQYIRENPHCAEQLKNAFWGHILTLLNRLGGIGAAQQNSQDLMQSAIESVLTKIMSVDFRTQAEFISYLRQSIKWKANNQVGRNRHKAFMGNEDAAKVQDPQQGPATRVEQASLHGRARKYILRLGTRDRYLVWAKIERVPMKEQSKHLDLNIDTCRKASQRAWKITLIALREEHRS